MDSKSLDQRVRTALEAAAEPARAPAMQQYMKSSMPYLGWALRQYAWTDPDEIARHVAANEDRLSGLSRREALKNSGTRRGERDF